MKRFILSITIAVATSSLTLWLIENPIKYFFFIFQILLTAALTWILIFPQFTIVPKLVITQRKFVLLVRLQVNRLDCLFSILSAILFLLNVFDISTPVNILLAFIVVSLLPGYVLLRLAGIFNSIPYTEALILSYALSLALSGVLPTLFMPTITQSNRLAFLGLLTFLSVVPILKDLAKKPTLPEWKTEGFKLTSTQLLTFVVVLVFFSIVLIRLYPQMSLSPGHDIVRNLSKARLWSLSPEYSPSLYPLFHIYQAAIYSVSAPSLEVYQTFLAFTSLSVLFSFYIMAKKYLDEIDNRLSMVATVFWVMFSGFGWVYLFQNKLEQINTTQLSLINMAYDATYADIGYGLSTNLWLYGFLAMTASFTIFFTLLYLLRSKNIPKAIFMLLISILVMALYFIHASELVIFALLLVVLEFFGQRSELRLSEALSSTFVGLISVSIVFQFMFDSLTHDYVLYSLVALVGLSYLFHQIKWTGLSLERRSQIIKISTYILMTLFMAGLLGWLPSAANFSISYVGQTFLVPWFFYPVRLGLIGFLGLLGMIIVANKYCEKAIGIFPLLFFSAWIAGRLVSFINVNFFYTGYWEWRFLFFSFAAASIASTIFLKHANLEKIIPKKSLRLMCSTSFLMGLLVLGGISSTFLTVEGMLISTNETNLLDKNELDAISFLSSALLCSEPAPLLSVTSQSANTMEFVPSPWVDKSIQPVLWSPEYPEVPLTFMYNMKFPPPYIYLHQRDVDTISNTELQDGYIWRYFLQFATEVYANSEVRIYQASEGVPPLHNGESVLVMHLNESSENDFLASYILSLGGYNCTTMLDSDPEILERDTLIFPSDSIAYADVGELGLGDGKKIIILNLGGYGELSRVFFESHKREKMKATHLVTPEGEKYLPLEIELSLLIPREETHTLCWYADGSEKVPLVAMQMVDNQTELFYLNVFPIAEAAFPISQSSRNLFQILASLLDFLELPEYDKGSTSWVIEDGNPVFAFKEGSLSGNISIQAKSFTPSEKLNLQEVHILINNNQLLLKDVVSLSVQNIGGEISLLSQDVIIGNGRGFYASVIANNPQITIKGDKIVISASTRERSLKIEGSATVTISIKGIFSIYLRNPRIENIGESLFREVYAFHSYLQNLQTIGQDLLIKGRTEFGLPLSDEYNVASDFTWDGSVTRQPPVFTWDELRSLEESIPSFILATCIFSVSLIATKRLRIRVRRRPYG